MFKIPINTIVLTMVFLDFFINTAFGIVAPFFAIFITRSIEGGTATVAGLATAIYWVVKSLIQLPIARWLDKTDGERDDFWALFAGYFAIGFVPLIYFFSSQPWHIYAAQVFFGFCMAWAVPAWFSIFTRHLDKFRISFEWSLYSVFSVGLSTALAGAIGGVLVDEFGFRVIFIIASILIWATALGLLTIRRNIYFRRDHLEKVIPERKLEKR
jgi:MFS family permease